MPGVRDIDHGFGALMRDFRLFARQKPRVFVGILQDKGSEITEGDDITLAGYAAANEFGTEKIPERSFLRSTVDENALKYNQLLEKSIDAMIDGARTGVPGAAFRAMEQKLGHLGLRAVRDVKNKIRDLREPPNATYTLEQKYPADNPLIHTGRMRQSISFLVDMTGRSDE